MSNTSNVPNDNELGLLLETTGNELISSGNIKPLRKIERFLWNWKDNGKYDINIRFLTFFLSVYIDKIFYNLTGDVPYVEGITKEVQVSFYNTLGRILYDMGTYLQEGKYSELYACYIRLGIAYIDAVNALNEGLQNKG